MKTITLILITILTVTLSLSHLKAQNRSKLAVLHIDTRGVVLTPELAGSMVRREVQKLKKYSVMDQYDMEHLLADKDLKIEGCYGTICASKVGELLGTDYVMTGSIHRFGEKLLFTLKLVDAEHGKVVKNSVMEFQNLQPHLQKMTHFVLADMYDLEVDKVLLDQLRYLETPVVNKAARLNASGPRLGLAYVTRGTGDNTIVDYLNEREAYPVLTQFGYQHEIQYLSTGNFQALFEVVGLASGMDQGMFIPSISILNGFRNSKNGLEMAFGPVLSLHVDTDDDVRLVSKWAWAVGKTFRSGNLNIPVNVYCTPNKRDGWFIGCSFGFNLAKRSYNLK